MAKPWEDGEERTIGTIRYKRVKSLDRRFGYSDDYAGDAFVRWVAVGQEPESNTELVEALRATLPALMCATDGQKYVGGAELEARVRAVLAKVRA